MSYHYWCPGSRTHAPQQAKLPQQNTHTPQLESSLCSLQLEKAHSPQKTQHSQKKKIITFGYNSTKNLLIKILCCSSQKSKWSICKCHSHNKRSKKPLVALATHTHTHRHTDTQTTHIHVMDSGEIVRASPGAVGMTGPLCSNFSFGPSILAHLYCMFKVHTCVLPARLTHEHNKLFQVGRRYSGYKYTEIMGVKSCW